MADDEPKPVSATLAAGDEDEPLFDPSLKKKKKKKAVVFDPLDVPPEADDTTAASASAATDITPATTATTTDDLDFSDLKLKKKKKKVPIDLDDTEGTGDGTGDKGSGTATPLDVAEEFADLKKKKKKGGKKAFDLEAFEKELAEAETAGVGGADRQLRRGGGEGATPGGSDDEDAGRAGGVHDEDDGVEDGLFHREGEDGGTGVSTANTVEEKSKTQLAAERKAWLKELDRDYTYDELLGRFYQALFISHPSLSTGPGKKRYTVPPPIVQREGNKRSIWANVGEICKRMHRQPEHVIQFLFAELGTNGSVDGQQNLVIKGRFQQKQIENVLRRYIVEYVTCKTCKSPDTLLEKDNRLYFVTCETCGSKRSVTAIKTGFSAQIGKRKAAQN